MVLGGWWLVGWLVMVVGCGCGGCGAWLVVVVGCGCGGGGGGCWVVVVAVWRRVLFVLVSP